MWRDSVRKFFAVLLWVVLLGASPVLARADGDIAMASKVPYAEGISVAETVLNQCDLEVRVAKVLAAASPRLRLVESLRDVPGLTLTVQITEVQALPGGFFSGPKALTLYGTLKDSGKTVGSFRAKRFSTSASGTCATLEKVAAAIGQDVAVWLTAPTLDAELGDAR